MDDLIMKANDLEDTRQAWKIKHNLVDILVIVMLSVLTGHNDFEEMVIFAEARLEILRKYIKLENGIPHKDTIKRVVAIIDPNQLNLVFYSWLANIINEKNHTFLDEVNKIIVLNCQYEIANTIVEKKDNYVLALKGNKGTLYEDVVDYFDEKTIEQITAKNELYKKTIDKAHSCIETREYFFILDIDYMKKNKGINYNKLTSIGLVRKTKENLNTGEIIEERRYYINSIYDIDLFSKTVRKEWSIENNLHWHLDYTLKEDYSTIINKKVAFNLNIIRKSVLSMLKIIDVGKKYSLKNKIHYINDNFETFFPNIIEQLSSQVSTK